MIAGVCWPFGAFTGEPQHLDPAWLERLKRYTGAEWLRIDCDWRNPESAANVGRAIEAGFRVLPILQADYPTLKAETKPGSAGPHLHGYLVWAIQFVTLFKFPYVEVLNEPHILHSMRPETYAQIANAVGEEMRRHCPATKVIVAAECWQPNDKGPKPIDWFARAVAGMRPDLWDIAGQHPYREPAGPDVVRRQFQTRRNELAWVSTQAGGKPVMTTEVGWNAKRVSLVEQAAHCRGELDINEAVGSLGCFLYCHQEDPQRDFGLLTRDGLPRPAAHMFKEWNAMRQAA